MILHANKNRGTVRNLNHALQHANGEYIKIIAGDDVFYNEQVFKQQVSFLQNNPQYSFVIGNVIECDAEMNMTNLTGFKPDGVLSLLEQPKDVLLKYIVRDNPGILAVQAICFRRTFYQWFGKFDEDYYLIEDLPMAVKAIDAGIPFGYIDFPCVKHRGSIGVSTSNEAFDPKRIMYYQDLLKYYDKTLSPIQNVVGKMYVRMRRQLIQYCLRIFRPLSITLSQNLGDLFFISYDNNRQVILNFKLRI